MQADLLIHDGTVIDGTAAPPFRGGLAIKDGKILDIGAIEKREGVPCLDAQGLYIAPGFIDIHSHSDFTMILDPRAMSSITQGVTLEVVGNCGHGCAPIGDPELAKMNIYGHQEGHEIGWRTMAEYFATLEAGKPTVNVASLVPNGNLRLAVAGLVDRPSTPDELKRMKILLAQCLEEGAFGFSTGLEYGPERDCSEAEIIELCRVAADAGGFYATHTRNRDGEAQETIAEAIRAGVASNLPLQISHISVVARLIEDGRWAIEDALRQVDEAQGSGLDVGFDMHTRLFGTTNLSAALPPWALEGDKASVGARLQSAATRRELKTYPSIITALARGDWNNIVLFDSKAHPEFSRKSIAEISELTGVGPFDTIYNLLLAEIDDLHSLMILAFTYREEDIRIAFEHPSCMVGSDATALAPDGPLAGTSFHGAYTWASWFYRHFVRDKQSLSPQEAIRRLTSLPASRLGLTDRGVLRKGVCADVVIFDPVTFADQGTTFEPNQTAVGMRHVVVNGKVALKDGVLTGERSGHVLRRT